MSISARIVHIRKCLEKRGANALSSQIFDSLSQERFVIFDHSCTPPSSDRSYRLGLGRFSDYTKVKICQSSGNHRSANLADVRENTPRSLCALGYMYSRDIEIPPSFHKSNTYHGSKRWCVIAHEHFPNLRRQHAEPIS